MIERGRMPPHAPLWAFPSEASVLAFWRAGGASAANVASLPRVLVLNSPAGVGVGPEAARGVLGAGVPGEWSFHLAPTPAAVPLGFFQVRRERDES